MPRRASEREEPRHNTASGQSGAAARMKGREGEERDDGGWSHKGIILLLGIVRSAVWRGSKQLLTAVQQRKGWERESKTSTPEKKFLRVGDPR